jgi:hypothetical protein
MAKARELRKLYAVVVDDSPSEDGYLRVIDESGEDYLYPARNFAPVELSEDAAAAFTLQGVQGTGAPHSVLSFPRALDLLDGVKVS